MNNLKYRAFPEFYREYAPKLIEFFGGWVDWLNEEGNAGYIVDHLSTEHDIDESIDAYATHLKYKLLVDFPDFLASDMKLLLKNIFYLYNSKSSIQSYEFLFRCLFNSPATITYPKEFILKTSDGRWSFPYYLQTEGYDILMHLDVYNWFKLEGKKTHAIGYIDGADVFRAESGEFESCLRVTSVTGTFEKGEDLELTNPETGEIVDVGDFKVKQYLMDYTDGRWSDTKGLLDSDMVIQDSYYYQDFSYIIRSNVPMYKWRALVKSLIHPAGLEFFGELALVDDSDDGISPRIVSITPYAFISQWHLALKLYCLAEIPSLYSVTWHYSDFRMAQLQSETLDNWIYRGIYKKTDGFWNMNVGFSNKHANRSSVIMFRDDGTLIDPAIIKWGVMEFSSEIKTNLLHGITLHPDKTIAIGNITGNEWKPEYNESFINERVMVFITQMNDDSSYLIKDMILRDDYKADVNGNIEDKTVRDTSVVDTAVIPIDERDIWKNLTIQDFVSTSLDKKEFFDEYSYLKIPEDYVEIDDGYYKFPKRHYDNEKIIVFSYSDNDISERFFFENIYLEKEHVFQMKSVTTKDYIICFIDGKFTNDFTVNDMNIVVNLKNCKYVEVYVLAPIEASRKLTEKYAGDEHFVYNNVRKWPYTVYNTHITKFAIMDYPEKGYQLVDDAANWRLQWVNTLSEQQALTSTSHLYISGCAQRHSETLDEWISRGDYYQVENVHDRVVADIDRISNAHSTLVFSEDGKLISPNAIEWNVKRIVESSSKYGKFLYSLPIMAESVSVHFTMSGETIWPHSNNPYLDINFGDACIKTDVLINDDTENETGNLHVNNNVLQILDDEHFLKNMGDLNITDYVHQLNDSADIVYDNNKLESIIQDNTNFIEDNYIVFVNGLKLPESTIISDIKNKMYIFSEPITGDVYIFHPSKYYKQSYYYNEGSVKNITINEKEELDIRRIIVYRDGLLYHDWKYELGKITLKEESTKYVEVYILSPYSYFYQDMTHFDEDNEYFTFNNLRKMNYMSSTSWITKYTEVENTISQLESIINMSLMSRAILENRISLYKSNMNYVSSDAPEVIPQYDTFDRLLYDGTYDIINFENMPVSFLEKELNKFSTMLFDADGALINPNIITWSLIRLESPISSKTLTPVVLECEHPATIGKVVTNNYAAIQIREASASNRTLLDSENMNTINELSASSKIVQDVSMMTTDSISELSAINYLYYRDDDVEKIPHFIPNVDEYFDTNQLIFINGVKVYHDDWYLKNNVYYFNNVKQRYNRPIIQKIQLSTIGDNYEIITDDMSISKINQMCEENSVLDMNFNPIQFKELSDNDYVYIRYTPNEQDIVMFQYNNDDMENYYYRTNSTNRFFELASVGYLPCNVMVFKNGLLTDDFYISGNVLALNSLKNTDFVEIYTFDSYDYLFINKNKYNNHCREFTVTNIKRSRYF